MAKTKTAGPNHALWWSCWSQLEPAGASTRHLLPLLTGAALQTFATNYWTPASHTVPFDFQLQIKIFYNTILSPLFMVLLSADRVTKLFPPSVFCFLDLKKNLLSPEIMFYKSQCSLVFLQIIHVFLKVQHTLV